MSQIDAQSMLAQMFDLKDQLANERRQMQIRPTPKPLQPGYNPSMDPQNPFLARKVQALQRAGAARVYIILRGVWSRLNRGMLWARIDKVPRPGKAKLKKPKVPPLKMGFEGLDESRKYLMARLESDRLLTERGEESLPLPPSHHLFAAFGGGVAAAMPETLTSRSSRVQSCDSVDEALEQLAKCESELQATINEQQQLVEAAVAHRADARGVAAAVLRREMQQAQTNADQLELALQQPCSETRIELLQKALLVAQEAVTDLMQMMTKYEAEDTDGSSGLSVGEALGGVDTAEAEAKKSMEAGKLMINGKEDHLTAARQQVGRMLKKAVDNSTQQLKDLEETLSECVDPEKQQQVMQAVAAARAGKDEAQRLLVKMGIAPGSAASVSTQQSQGSDSNPPNKKRLQVLSTAPQPVAPSVVKANRKAAVEEAAHEAIVSAKFAQVDAGLRCGEPIQVQWVQKTVESLHELRTIHDSGEMGWAMCQRLMERMENSWATRQHGCVQGLDSLAVSWERSRLASVVFMWQLQMLSSGPTPAAAVTVQSWWRRNTKRITLVAMGSILCWGTTQCAVVSWGSHCQAALALEREERAERMMMQAKLSTRKRQLLVLGAMRSAIECRGGLHHAIQLWEKSSSIDRHKTALTTRCEVLVGLAYARAARLTAACICLSQQQSLSLLKVGTRMHNSLLRRTVQIIRNRSHRQKACRAAARRNVVNQVLNGGPADLWDHLNSTEPSEHVERPRTRSALRDRSKSAMAAKAMHVGVGSNQMTRQRKDRSPRRQGSVCETNRSRGSTDRSCVSAPPYLPSIRLLDESPRALAATRAADKARERAERFGEGAHEDALLQVQRILKASGTKRFGKRRSGQALQKLMQQSAKIAYS